MTHPDISPVAEEEVADIVEWINSDNPPAANAFIDRFVKTLAIIGEYPNIGQEKPYLASQPIRFHPIQGYPYTIVYDSDLNPPLVLRVLHGARDLPELLKDIEQ